MDDVTFAQGFSKELDAETASTRKCIERFRMDLYEYKPHPTSMIMGYLAQLCAEIPLWIPYTLSHDYIDFKTFEHIKFTTVDELVAHFDKNVKDAKDALAAVRNGDLAVQFDLKADGKVMFSSSKRDSLESMINHMVHHRGQLTVYMRLNGIAVPSIYGPSADEKGF